MAEAYPYATHLNNQALRKVNDSVVRLGVIPGEYYWDKHDDEGEFFYGVEGKSLVGTAGIGVLNARLSPAPTLVDRLQRDGP